ncbi:hypothetical protein JX265_009921 [Neoarthrinium moseri]|uniref:Phytanoyl-CoA dioxygenase n=1 Tax=Neoarthrinium moseri TaxID=1658444 RepID=A0A9Q0AM68_9PEZI|nr:hypothetical protein JX265_009921 [Neoarthrinium moseri]
MLVSIKALNITWPLRPGHMPRTKWPNVDQSPFRKGLQCVQRIVDLSQAGPNDGGLTVDPGSHKAPEPFSVEHTYKSIWSRKDFYTDIPEEISWFEKQRFHGHKVVAELGDLIIWDSRLIHYGAEPTKKSNTIRMVVYISYAPAALASQAAFLAKNWPHDDIKPKIKFSFAP